MRAWVLVLCVLGLAVAGCGADDEAQAPAPSGEDRLTVTVWPRGPDGPRERRILDCAGADATACDRLSETDLSPTPPQQACTQIYGGPAVARIRGRLDGEPVDVRFSRESGCEIARWDRVAWLLGDPPPTGGG